MRRLLLWDLDGTLIHFHGATVDAFAAAISRAAERPVEDGLIDYLGKGLTDPMIARESLIAMGIAESELDTTVRRALRLLGKEMARLHQLLRERGEVLPGVRELLESLGEHPVLNTMVTGNIAVNAVLKLDIFRLTKYFDLEVGGFGSDASARVDIAEKAINRVSDLRKKWFNEEDTWIIGDTPRDAEVAEKLDLRCLLVATGSHSVEELSMCRADLVVDDLSDTETIVTLLSQG